MSQGEATACCPQLVPAPAVPAGHVGPLKGLVAILRSPWRALWLCHEGRLQVRLLREVHVKADISGTQTGGGPRGWMSLSETMAAESISRPVTQPCGVSAGPSPGGRPTPMQPTGLHLDTVQPPVQVSGEYRSVQASRWPSFTRTCLTGTCPWLVLGLWHMLSTWL